MTDPESEFPRRAFAALGAGSVWLAAASGELRAAEPGKGGWLDVRDCGAKGDGKTDDTKALQSALDAAGERLGAVFVPPGIYQSGELRMRRNTSLVGVPSWDYRRTPAGSTIRLIDEKASCLLNITGAPGVTIDGMALDGGGLGQGIHGIFLNKPDPGKEEDTFRIVGAKVARFSGTGVMLSHVWCFSVRQSMIAYNRGDGIRCLGWDAFIMDNWLSGNGGCGWEGTASAAITATGNRIEWNRKEGILIAGGNHYNITGNYLDRSGNSGIAVIAREGRPSRQVTITGNVIYRSGKNAAAETPESSQLRLEGSRGVTCTGNAMNVGRDDGGRGTWSPSYGILCRAMENSVVKDNVLDDGALGKLIHDLGEHGDGFILKDNPGRLFVPKPV